MSRVYTKNASSPVNFYKYKGAQKGPKELEGPQGSKQIPEEKEIPMKSLNRTTIAEVVEDIIKRLTEYHKAYIVNTAEANLIQLHHEWGASIRNRYNLDQNKALLKAAGKAHADGASMVIIKAVWKALRESG